jgi:ADP-heptose:LPS heptosyltransferase
VSLKNALLKTFFSLRSSRARKQATDRERILVVATTALGDTLWATPAIESLRKSFPQAYIACLTSPIGMQILGHNPFIDTLYRLEEPMFFHFWNLRKRLLAETFDTVLIFHASQRLIFPLCASIGANRIVGTAKINKGLDFLLTDPLPSVRQHEIARRLQIVEHIGGSIHAETLSIFLQPEERFPKRNGRWVAIHPGSKDGFKRWPEKNFATVARNLQALGYEILITGTKEEAELMKKTADLIPGAEIADTNLPLRRFAALLEQMDLLICNDTGPFHLACALNRPVIGIYAATDPFLCGSYKASHACVISKKASCTPCLKRKCNAPFCLLQIGTCEVSEAAIKILSHDHLISL